MNKIQEKILHKQRLVSNRNKKFKEREDSEIRELIDDVNYLFDRNNCESEEDYNDLEKYKERLHKFLYWLIK